MAKPKKLKEPKEKIVEIPRIKCSYCGQSVDPTEQSVYRLVEKGFKNAAPFYVCACSPGDLQVYPGWHRLYGLGAMN